MPTTWPTNPIHKLLLDRDPLAGAACHHRSIWIRPTTRRTAPSSSRSSMGTMAVGYLPLLAFLTFDREAEQYLCAAVLRPGKAVAAEETLGLLCRLLPLLRAAFPRARCGVSARLRNGNRGRPKGIHRATWYRRQAQARVALEPNTDKRGESGR